MVDDDEPEGSDAGPTPPDDDRRVKDLARAAARPTDEIDPKTAADLARWFGLPSFQELADHGVQPVLDEYDRDPEVVARRKVIAAASEAVDKVFLETFFARGETYGAMVTPLPPMRLTLDRAIGVADPDLVRRPPEPGLYEVALETREEMEQMTPQAVLRDLHRIVEEYGIRYEIDERTAVEWTFIDAREEIRAEMRRPRGLAPQPTVLEAARAARAEMVHWTREVAWGETNFSRGVTRILGVGF
jgi:hypothetical protein